MQTSYFGKYNGENAVSIAGKCPAWFEGRQYKKLAPKYTWWEKWHAGQYTNAEYKQLYHETVLDTLDPHEVYRELGENAVLLCWESPGEFCHRRIVAEWLEKELGIRVTELSLAEKHLGNASYRNGPEQSL